MHVELSDETEQDIADGIAFYDRSGETVGEHFRRCILQDAYSLELLGGMHEVLQGYHRMPAKRFPFAIDCRTRGELIQVIAIFDCRMSPDRIAARLLGDG